MNALERARERHLIACDHADRAHRALVIELRINGETANAAHLLRASQLADLHVTNTGHDLTRAIDRRERATTPSER